MSIFETIFDNEKIKRIRIPNWISHYYSAIPEKQLTLIRSKLVLITKRTKKGFYLSFPEMTHEWRLDGYFLRNGNLEEILMCGEKECNRILCPTINWFDEQN